MDSEQDRITKMNEMARKNLKEMGLHEQLEMMRQARVLEEILNHCTMHDLISGATYMVFHAQNLSIPKRLSLLRLVLTFEYEYGKAMGQLKDDAPDLETYISKAVRNATEIMPPTINRG